MPIDFNTITISTSSHSRTVYVTINNNSSARDTQGSGSTLSEALYNLAEQVELKEQEES